MKKLALFIFILSIVYSCKDEPKTEKEVSREVHQQLVDQLTDQVRQFPDSPQVRMRLINALDSLGNYQQALVHVDTMIMRDSANNGLWYAKGQLHESNGDTAAAIRSYETALNIYPSIEAQFSLANLFAEKRDARSLQICQALRRMGLDREATAHADFITGIYYARTAAYDKAIAAFDECIKNNYTYMVAYMEKGFIYFEQKKYNEALQVFDRAITVNNMYADAYYWKAKTNEAMGNKEEAITNYQRSLGLDKQLTEAREALKRLGT